MDFRGRELKEEKMTESKSVLKRKAYQKGERPGVPLQSGVSCLGMDMKLHICEPHSDKAICGEAVRKKNLTLKDRENRFSCYECTY